MRTKLILPLIALLLVSVWPYPHHDNDTVLRETVKIKVSEPSATDIFVLSDGEGSSGQDIVLKNPTFQELRDFILRDPTSRNKFVPNKYECRHFATEVCNNAEAEGLRCAFVLLGFARGQHAVVAFDTTDRGLVYIETQTDCRIHPEVGGKYQGKEIKEILIAW